MRLGFGLMSVTLALAACSDRRAELAASWGCGPVEGMAGLQGDAPPDWILIGEVTETAEAPAAVADIACNLATDEQPLFVGVPDYLGGATDAETHLLQRLDDFKRKGASITVGRIGGDDHPWTVREKSKGEKAWAQALGAQVRKSGAARALLFLSYADAIAEPIPPSGERFAGYSPMPVFLNGSVVSLEVAPAPERALPGPVIRIHSQVRDGFHGQLALNRLTRPMIAVLMPEPRPPQPVETPPPAVGPDGNTPSLPVPSLLDMPLDEGPAREKFLDDLLKALPVFEPE